MGADYVDLLVIGGGINGAGIARDAAGRGLKVVARRAVGPRLRHLLRQHETRPWRPALPGVLRVPPRTRVAAGARATAGDRPAHRAPDAVHPAARRGLATPLADPPGTVFLRPRWRARQRLPASRGVRLAGTWLRRAAARADRTRLRILGLRGRRQPAGRPECGRRGEPRRHDPYAYPIRFCGACERTLARECRDTATARVLPHQRAGHRQRLWPLGRTRSALHARRHERIADYAWSKAVTSSCRDSTTASMPSCCRIRTDASCSRSPTKRHFTLIGTTDVPCESAPDEPEATAEEIEYLCATVNRLFPPSASTARDVVWSYAGVRPLVDDDAAEVSKVTRDYRLELSAEQPALLSVFGGKLTTYRKLAETALGKLHPYIGGPRHSWTASCAAARAAICPAGISPRSSPR